MEQFWHAFTSHGFDSVSWAFLFGLVYAYVSRFLAWLFRFGPLLRSQSLIPIRLSTKRSSSLNEIWYVGIEVDECYTMVYYMSRSKVKVKVTKV